MSDVPALVARFEACTLPKEDWTHQAHLTVGLWYASRMPYEAALVAVRSGIQRLNAAHGLITTPTRGYHETITRLFLHGVRLFLAEANASEPLHELVNELLLSPMGRRDWPLRFYSPERLFSVEARREFIAPDLASLP
jgi:hypothetical protein